LNMNLYLVLLKVLKVFSKKKNSNRIIYFYLVITRAKSLKIARFAFELAKQDERKKVTAVHKANIM